MGPESQWRSLLRARSAHAGVEGWSPTTRRASSARSFARQTPEDHQESRRLCSPNSGAWDRMVRGGLDAAPPGGALGVAEHSGVRWIDVEAPLLEVGIDQDRARVEHPARSDALALEKLHRPLGVAAADPSGDQLVELVVTGETLGQIQPSQLAETQHGAQRLPFGIGAHRDGEPLLVAERRPIRCGTGRSGTRLEAPSGPTGCRGARGPRRAATRRRTPRRPASSRPRAGRDRPRSPWPVRSRCSKPNMTAPTAAVPATGSP